MRALGEVFLRSLAVTAAVVLAAVLWFGLQGQLSARSLSDGLVYASFLVLAVGTVFGMLNMGYKRRPLLPGEPPEGPFEHGVKEFLQPGLLGWSIVLAGVLCFAVAAGVDLFF